MLKTADLRKLFETELKEALKLNFSDIPNIKISKNKIAIVSLNKENTGTLYFDYSNKGADYSLKIGVQIIEMVDFLKMMVPPYKARGHWTLEQYLKDNIMPMYWKSSVNEGIHRDQANFADFFYELDLPKTEAERKQACINTCKKLNNMYIPKVLSLIELKPEAIEDIIQEPTYYVYPFLLILYIAKKNGLKIADLDIEAIFNKEDPFGRKVIKNKDYDSIETLEKYL